MISLRQRIFFLAFTLFLLQPMTVCAEIDWISFTLDNDLFVGNDNGYTNGFYVSFFDVGETDDKIPSNGYLVSPLMWSMPKKEVKGAVNAYMVGQTMSTPSDIRIVVPDAIELPYSALLALTNSYVTVKTTYADRSSTTLGVVGPAAFGEEAQKNVHEVIGSDEPQGWDTQLKNEFVFQFSRARTWRLWVNNSDSFDLLTNTELRVGTIQSSIDTNMTIRLGSDLISSYATTLFNSSRTINPNAVNNGWYIYTGINCGYIFNQIFTDGNTYRNSRSIDYQKEYIGVTAGLSYSWESLSLAFAINDTNIIQGGSREKVLENLTRFGTLSLAYKF